MKHRTQSQAIHISIRVVVKKFVKVKAHIRRSNGKKIKVKSYYRSYQRFLMQLAKTKPKGTLLYPLGFLSELQNTNGPATKVTGPTFSTSNHNPELYSEPYIALSIILFLHQITTLRCLSLMLESCLLSFFYIKPQLH